MEINRVVIETKLALKKFFKGKIRDVYELDQKSLLIISTDRISCFDYVLPTPIPSKGEILNKLSIFWFKFLEDIINNHFISDDITKLPSDIFENTSIHDIKDRFMIVKKARRINIECVVRGYLAGSAWEEYQKYNSISGIKLPTGLKESDKLPQPIFTPAIKSMSGHDINITEQDVVNNEGEATTNFLKEKSIFLYNKAQEYAQKQGIIIADTKFEFGIYDEKEIILIDEILTPDSSRFWEKSKYVEGLHQEPLDKQFVRDYLISIKWNKQPPVPQLSEEIVNKTKEKYSEIYRLLVH